MDRLRDDEHKRLADLEEKSEALQDKLREQERRLHAAETALEETGLQHSGPDPERIEAIELQLQGVRGKVGDRSNARNVLARADAGLKRSQEYFNDAGQPPGLDAQSLKQAKAIAAPLIKAQTRRDELQLKLVQAGDTPDEAEIDKLYDAGSALREWLAATAGESKSLPASPDRLMRLTLWIILAASGLAALLAGIQQACLQLWPRWHRSALRYGACLSCAGAVLPPDHLVTGQNSATSEPVWPGRRTGAFPRWKGICARRSISATAP